MKQGIYAVPSYRTPQRMRRSLLIGGVLVIANVITVSVGQATETDMAQAVSWAPKERLIVQATETDTAQAVTARKTRAVVQATETDTAQGLTKHKTKSVAQVTETDLAQSITVAQQGGVIARVLRAPPQKTTPGLTKRSMVLSGLVPSSILNVGVAQAAETDLAQAVTSRKTKVLGQSTETDTTQAITARKTRTLGQVTETETAQPITARKTRLLGQAAETDLAQSVTRAAVAVSIPTILRAPRPLPPLFRIPVMSSALVGLVPISIEQFIPVGQAQETDTAQSVTKRKTKAIGQTAETDLAQAIVARKTHAVGQVAETDLAQSLTRRKTKTLGHVTETDLAQPVTEPGQMVVAVTQAVETDLAQAIAWAPKERLIGQAAETDTAQPLTSRKLALMGVTLETDLAQALSRKKARTLGEPVETDLAQLILWSPKARFVGQASEFDAALAVLTVKGEQNPYVILPASGRTFSLEAKDRTLTFDPKVRLFTLED